MIMNETTYDVTGATNSQIEILLHVLCSIVTQIKR